jgi:hypothetical protein
VIIGTVAGRPRCGRLCRVTLKFGLFGTGYWAAVPICGDLVNLSRFQRQQIHKISRQAD